MNKQTRIFAFEKYTVAAVLQSWPMLKPLLVDTLDLTLRMKVSIRVQPAGLPVEISPALYDYTTRHVMATYEARIVIRYAGCSDNPQDVLCHTGGELGAPVPPGGLFVVADNHGRGTICLEIWHNTQPIE